MAANILISISQKNGHMTKILKTTFPKEFFKVGEHEQIYITEIRFKKKLVCF